MKRPDYVRKHYGPMQRRGLPQALAERIRREFPRIGGPRMVELCAKLVLEVVEGHLRPLEDVRHGQVVWLGVAIDDPQVDARPPRIRDSCRSYSTCTLRLTWIRSSVVAVDRRNCVHERFDYANRPTRRVLCCRISISRSC